MKTYQLQNVLILWHHTQLQRRVAKQGGEETEKHTVKVRKRNQ